jgi:ribose transport system substrate-binding protein
MSGLKSVWGVFGLGLVVLALAAWPGARMASARRADDGPRKKIIIGFVGKSVANAVFQAGASGARAAAAAAPEEYGVDVDLLNQTPSEEDPQKQSQAIDDLVRAGAAGIAVSCSNGGTVTPAIDRAMAAGVWVVCFDSDAPRSKRFAFYGADDVDCGRRLMTELAKVMDGKGTIAILAGNPAAPNLQARVRGVREKLKDFPDMHELNDGHGVFNHAETPADAVQAVKMAENANPGIEGWAMVGGWPLFARNAFSGEPGARKICSVDALPAQLQYVRDGYVQVLLAQDCYGWGDKSVHILLDKIVKQKDPPNQRTFDPLTRVTKDNVDEFAKNWDKWLKNK